jgi:hypothetical protein
MSFYPPIQSDSSLAAIQKFVIWHNLLWKGIFGYVAFASHNMQWSGCMGHHIRKILGHIYNCTNWSVNHVRTTEDSHWVNITVVDEREMLEQYGYWISPLTVVYHFHPKCQTKLLEQTIKVRGGSSNMPVNPNSSSKVLHKSSIFLSNAINFPICRGGTHYYQVLKILKLWKRWLNLILCISVLCNYVV